MRSQMRMYLKMWMRDSERLEQVFPLRWERVFYILHTPLFETSQEWRNIIHFFLHQRAVVLFIMPSPFLGRFRFVMYVAATYLPQQKQSRLKICYEISILLCCSLFFTAALLKGLEWLVQEPERNQNTNFIWHSFTLCQLFWSRNLRSSHSCLSLPSYSSY